MGLGDNSRSALYLSFALLTFVTSLSIGLFLFKSAAATNDMTYTMTTKTDKNLTTTLKIPTIYTVSGAEVRQSIYMIKDIGVDIVVEGVTFSKNIDPSTINVSSISINKQYTPSYVRDTKGNLTLLRFN